VVDVANGRLLPGRTVLITQGVITEIAVGGGTRVPAGALHIDADGRYLMPGLIDTHVHVAWAVGSPAYGCRNRRSAHPLNHVGSKDEREGKTGLAHLFEHIMFNGSENYDDDWFNLMERIGATGLNGTTSSDRTNYFQNVPVSALDTALWMESDRMGHLLGAVTQERLDEQRRVVQNEKRMFENEPYSQNWGIAFRNLFPEGHPYSWTVIGSMEDLEAATLDDVHEWFREYYGASNAVIVVAGDVDPDDVHQRVQRFFGHIDAGPPLARHQSWVPRRAEPQRIRKEDRVPQARIYKYWTMPQDGTADADYLSLAASVLATGRNSRLHERLVHREQIATDVAVFALRLEIAGVFAIYATVQPGGDAAAVERALDEEIARLIERGVNRNELERVKTGYRAGFIRGIERIGGFGGKSDVLASGEVYFENPHQYKERLARIAAATPQQVSAAVRRWLSQGALTLDVQPFPQYRTAQSDVDRSAGPPQPADFPSVDFPEPERATLANGMRVLLVNRPTIPVVNFSLLVDAGYAADQFGAPGTANLALGMMTEGTRRRHSLQISDQLQRLGANLDTSSNLDQSVVSLSALKENLDASLDLYADVILNPSFPEADFNRRRQQQLASIQREQVTPFEMALRVFPRLLYGEDHAYALPLTGSGTLDAVRGLTPGDLRAFHRTWFRSNNATLVVVGDISMQELMPRLERQFRGWERGDVPQKNIAEYWDTYADNIRGLSRDELQAAARAVVRPDGLVWVVVGDRRRVESSIRELGFGEIRFLDADGNPVK
jgi:zinc protease